MYQGYFIGQRVLINDAEIGKVVAPPPQGGMPFDIWVYSPSRGYSCCYAYSSIKPLPNGQL